MRKQRKKYKKPGHPWQAGRINEEVTLSKEYGLTNKKEIWRITSLLRNWQRQARGIFALTDDKKEKATKELISKLVNLNVLKENSQLDDVLALTVREILNRRLQTVIYRMGVAGTIKQARQLIIHKKIKVSDKLISSPSYLVKKTDNVDILGGRVIIKKKTAPKESAKPEVLSTAENKDSEAKVKEEENGEK